MCASGIWHGGTLRGAGFLCLFLYARDCVELAIQTLDIDDHTHTHTAANCTQVFAMRAFVLCQSFTLAQIEKPSHVDVLRNATTHACRCALWSIFSMSGHLT